MIKTKNTPSLRHEITTNFGYGVFALVLLSFLSSTVLPMASAFQSVNARHFNIVTLGVVFATALFLPALVSYFIGDKVTHSNKKSLHHYNGVLLGLTAYWIATLVSWINFKTVFGIRDDSYPALIIVTNIPAVVFTIIVISILAVFFAKNQKNNASILHYFPFQLTFIIAVIGTFVAPYVVLASDFSFDSIIYLLIPIIATATAYAVLKKQKLSRLSRIGDALVALSVGWIAIWPGSSFLSFFQLPYQIINIGSYIFGLVIFAAYLYLRVRKS